MKGDLGGVWEIMGFFGGKEGCFWYDLMELASMDLIQVSHQKPKREENLEF